MRHQRYVMLAFVVLAILAGWATQSATDSAFAQFAIVDERLLGLLATSTLISLGVGVVVFAVLIRNRRALTFSDEVVGEIAQITWPTRDESVRAATTVVLTALFVSALVAVYDTYFKNLADLFLFTEHTFWDLWTGTPRELITNIVLVIVVPIAIITGVVRQYFMGDT